MVELHLRQLIDNYRLGRLKSVVQYFWTIRRPTDAVRRGSFFQILISISEGFRQNRQSRRFIRATYMNLRKFDKNWSITNAKERLH